MKAYRIAIIDSGVKTNHIAFANKNIIGYSLELDSFGKVIKNSDFEDYIGHETGLFLITSKFFDSKIGRYISPCEVEELSPQSISGMNLYSYAINNTVIVNSYTETMAKAYGVSAIAQMSVGGLNLDDGGNGFCLPKLPWYLSEFTNIAGTFSSLRDGYKAAQYVWQNKNVLKDVTRMEGFGFTDFINNLTGDA